MVQIEGWSYFFAAFLLMTLPLNWLLGALTAAGVHELCHYGAGKLLGGRINRVQVGLGGAVMDIEICGKGRELLCTLAGPAGSFSVLVLCHVFPEAAVCGMMQGLFNLLPVYPLDGGRALTCLLELFGCRKAEPVQLVVQWLCCIVLIVLAFIGRSRYSLGNLPFILALMLIIRAMARKRPCKRRQIGVQ